MAEPFEPAVILVTGGAGFIGSNVIRWVLSQQRSVRVINLDLLTYAGNLESLTDVVERHGPEGDGRYFFIRGDIGDRDLMTSLMAGTARDSVTGNVCPAPNAVLHLAAESHVDRSIMGPAPFVATNVQGTMNLLEAVRVGLAARPRPFRFVNVSTDEVYGSLGPTDRPFTEASPISPNSPYSASKAGADCLVRAYVETFKLPCLTTRCSNNYGPYQFPEKLIPLMITRALSDQRLPVYGDGMNVRDWIHVEDHAEGVWTVCTRGVVGQVYNIGGESEQANLELVRAILRNLGKPESLITFVADRPGHDRRYAIDISRMRKEFGWQPRRTITDGLAATITWYRENEAWWRRILSEAYRSTNALYLSAIS